jgi:hypothetical protein
LVTKLLLLPVTKAVPQRICRGLFQVCMRTAMRGSDRDQVNGLVHHVHLG